MSSHLQLRSENPILFHPLSHVLAKVLVQSTRLWLKHGGEFIRISADCGTGAVHVSRADRRQTGGRRHRRGSGGRSCSVRASTTAPLPAKFASYENTG